MPLFRFNSRLLTLGQSRVPFDYLDPGPLIDGELELVAPSARWTPAYLDACKHPTSVGEDPSLANTTRQQVVDFLLAAPDGHQKGDRGAGITPGYHFWMIARDRTELPVVGGVNLRIGDTYDTAMYYGHFGYHVYPFARGRHYAQRACRLLLPLSATHNQKLIWITCNPDNHGSRRTCEGLGSKLIEIVPLPVDHPLYRRGDREKCRYRLDIS